MIEVFWPWFFARDGRKTGLRLISLRWLTIDLTVAGLLTFSLDADGFVFAEKALFPAASILMGMAVAWTGQASVIVSSEKFQEKIITQDRRLEDYLYGYQMSILILFITIGYMAIMAAGGFKFFIYDRQISNLVSSFFMFFLVSLSTRECWSIINFTNLLSLLDGVIKKGPN